MASMKKKMIFILITLIVLGGIAIFSINQFFLPGKIKQLVINKAQETLKRKVTFGSIHFNLIRGFTVRDLTVYEKDSDSKPFVHIDEATFSLLFTPIFKENKFIIPSLTIINPAVLIVRQKDSLWNFSDLLPGTEAREEKKFPHSFFIGKILLTGGKVKFLDESLPTPLEESFEGIDLKAGLSLKKAVNYKFDVKIPKSQSSLSISGDFDLPTHKLTANVSASNILLDRYLPAYYKNEHFSLEQGQLKSAAFTVTRKGNDIQFEGAFELAQADIKLESAREIRGDFKSSHLSLGLKDKSVELIGDLVLNGAEVQLGTDQKLKGNIKINELSLKQNDQKLEIKSDFWIEGGQLQLGNEIFVNSDLKTAQTQFSWIKNDYQLKSDLQLDVREAILSPERKLSGQFAAANLALNSVNGEIQASTDLEIKSADLKLGENREFKGEIFSKDAKLNLKDKVIDFQSEMEIKNADFKIGNISMAGNPTLSLAVLFDPAQPVSLKYNGSLDPKSMTLKGIPYVDEVVDVNGMINIETDKILFPSLRITTHETPLVLSGQLSQFDAPHLDVKLTAQAIDLEKWSSLAPEAMAKAHITSLSGLADIDLHFAGLASAPMDADLTIQSKINKAALTSDKFPDKIQDISGEIDYAKDLLSWKELGATFREKVYSSTGQLENFAKPVIKTSLASDQIELDAHVNILNNAFQILLLTGTYIHSDFDLKGDIHLLEEDQSLDMSGKIDLDLADIVALAPDLKEQINKFNPSGKLAVSGIIKGALKDTLNWSLVLNATSPEIKIVNYKINDITFKYEQRDQNINNCDITALFYGGIFQSKLSADLRESKLPFRLMAQLEKTDLARFKNDTRLKDEDISGFLSGYLSSQGYLGDFKSMNGQGQARIEDGRLWQLNLFKGLGKLLLIPEYKDIVFTAASADFTIGDKRLSTNNLELTSTPLTLSGQGWMDFDGNLNFDIVSQFNTEPIEESKSIKRTMTAIMAQTNEYLTIKISGTLKDTKYSVKVSPGNMLEKTRDLIKEGIQSVF